MIKKLSPSARLNATNSRPTEAPARLEDGILLHQQGRLDAAASIYSRIIHENPDNVDASYLLGLVYLQSKNHSLAVDFISKAISLNADNHMYHCNLGVAFKELGQLETAVACYERAINLRPDYATAYSNLGATLKELGQFDAAVACCDKAISLKPDYFEAYSNRGNALNELGRFEAALACHDIAIKINSKYAEAYSNRGNSLQGLSRFEEAVASYDLSIKLKPDYHEAYTNRGNALRELKRFSVALESYDISISIKPDYVDANYSRAALLLLCGEFEAGFKAYEWRLKSTSVKLKKENLTQPGWLGSESLYGKKILLYSEQGLGDTIQFCRYVKSVADLGARVLLEVPQSLIGLLQELEGLSLLIERGQPLPDFDFHCPLLSLPLALKTNLMTIPGQSAYLAPRADRHAKWSKYLGSGGFKIGIAWQGATGRVDLGRSFPVRLFHKISCLPGARLISLQKNTGVDQLAMLPEGLTIEVLPDEFDSGADAFLDSAAVMKSLDLVITSDTAISHLAGALGVPTWTALKSVPEWRWLLDRPDSPWYPGHRLFRQDRSGDWDPVFDEIASALQELLLLRDGKKQVVS